MTPSDPISDGAFVAVLRAATERYLRAVDQWESAYQKYYRMPGFAGKVSRDLESQQREYEVRRRELEQMVPRARRLCLKYRVREPFSGLLRISLGQYAPQQRQDSAISRAERSHAIECLAELYEACREWDAPRADLPDEKRKVPLLRRLADYFD